MSRIKGAPRLTFGRSTLKHRKANRSGSGTPSSPERFRGRKVRSWPSPSSRTYLRRSGCVVSDWLGGEYGEEGQVVALGNDIPASRDLW